MELGWRTEAVRDSTFLFTASMLPNSALLSDSGLHLLSHSAALVSLALQYFLIYFHFWELHLVWGITVSAILYISVLGVP